MLEVLGLVLVLVVLLSLLLVPLVLLRLVLVPLVPLLPCLEQEAHPRRLLKVSGVYRTCKNAGHLLFLGKQFIGAASAG